MGSLSPEAFRVTTFTLQQWPQGFPGSPSEGGPHPRPPACPKAKALSTTWHPPEPQNWNVGLSKGGEGCTWPGAPGGTVPPVPPQRSRGWQTGFAPQGGPRSMQGSPWAGSSHTTLVFSPCPMPTTVDTRPPGEGRTGRKATPPQRPGPRAGPGPEPPAPPTSQRRLQCPVSVSGTSAPLQQGPPPKSASLAAPSSWGQGQNDEPLEKPVLD